jgi:hypothetical protein
VLHAVQFNVLFGFSLLLYKFVSSTNFGNQFFSNNVLEKWIRTRGVQYFSDNLFSLNLKSVSKDYYYDCFSLHNTYVLINGFFLQIPDVSSALQNATDGLGTAEDHISDVLHTVCNMAFIIYIYCLNKVYFPF